MTAIAVSLTFATPAFAGDAHHPPQAPEAGTVPTAPTVQKMQAQLNRIAAAKTDGEWQKAMAGHMRRPRRPSKAAGQRP